MARSHMVQVTELLRELGYKVENPTFMSDNEGAKKACRSAKFPDLARSKWTKALLLRNEVRMGLWKVEKIAAEDNLADAFTKPLLPNKEREMWRKWVEKGWWRMEEDSTAPVRS